MNRHFFSRRTAAIAAALAALCGHSLALARSGAASAARQGGSGGIAPTNMGSPIDNARPLGVVAAGPVVLYGDSLAWEAQDQFRHALLASGIREVQTETYGGTAICDWLDMMRHDAAVLRPRAVVIEFSGNALTRCMRDSTGVALTGRAYFDEYLHDAQTALALFGAIGSRVYLAGAPISRQAEADHDRDAGRLDAIYTELAASHPNTEFVNAGQAVLDDGHWTATLPCLAEEPCSGERDAIGRLVNVVRGPDGVHFCPNGHAATQGVTDTCSQWSSGAFRYGHAMAAPYATEVGSALGPSVRRA